MKEIRTKQQGFTLIELVVVIVILGILAVTAAPKFIDIQDDARTATIKGVKGAMASASALVHSKSLIAGNEDAATATITVSGVTVNIAYGYPTNVSTDWAALLDIDTTSEFAYTTLTDDYLAVYPFSGTAPEDLPADVNDPSDTEDTCFAYYLAPTAANTEPTIGSVICI